MNLTDELLQFHIYAQATKTKSLIGGFIRYLEGRSKVQDPTSDIGRRTWDVERGTSDI